MKRELKFRAWNVVTKTMIDLKKITPLALNMDTDGLFLPFSDGLPLMQFTGLKDKNGKEIYEGDILDFIFDTVGFIKNPYYVIFDGGAFVIKKPNFQPLVSDCRYIMVRGNIYENPELLNSNSTDERSVATDAK